MSTYRIDEEIGRGGMAVVYAGWHEQLERPVALKVLAEHLADDAEFRARFLREARIASKLHHSNLVQTYSKFVQSCCWHLRFVRCCFFSTHFSVRI